MNIHDAVMMWLSVQMAKPGIFGKIDWVHGREGKIYIRYSNYTDQIDLANFAIDVKHQGKGVARSIIASCCKLGVKTVRIENILNLEWAAKVREYQFPGRSTLIRSVWGEKLLTIDFVLEERGSYASL